MSVRERLSVGLLSSTTGIVIAMCPAPAMAQDKAAATNATDAPDRSEIIVTATRRDEKLSRVPASIAAFSQKKMDDQGVRSVEDIARLTPGLNFRRESRFSASNTNISLRGIESDVGAPTTGIYIDDVPIQARATGFSSHNVYPQVFDLERVEVLRGPQGTLFGAGAEGGVVRFITPQPSLTHYSGYARSELSFTQGGAPSYEAGAAVGGPIITDRLGFRVSAWERRDGGWIDRVDNDTGATDDKNANGQNILVLRGALTWQPLDGLTITPSLYYQRLHIEDSSGYWDSLTDAGKGEFRNGYVQAQPQTDRYLLPSLGVKYDMGPVTLVSTTSWFDRKQREIRDYTSYDAEIINPGQPYPTLPGQIATGFFGERQKNFTQEVRLQSNGTGPFNFVIGGFYSNERQTSSQANQDAYLDTLIRDRYPGLYDIASYFGAGYLPNHYIFNSVTKERTRQLAGFAQVDYNITRTLKLTAGVRVAHFKLDHSQYGEGPFAGGVIQTAGKASQTPTTPKFGVSWQVNRDNLLYASVAKGFRAGGAQTQLPNICQAGLDQLGYSKSPASYDADHVWSYELGSKNSMLGGALTVDASAYIIKWKNIQTSLYLPSCGSSFIANTGAVTSKGFDVSLSARPAEGLSLGLVLGYTHATYDHDVLGGSGLLIVGDGDYAFRGPKFSFTLSGEYAFPLLTADRDAFVRFDYSHGSPGPKNDPDAFGYDPVYTNGEATDQINARIGIRRSGLELSVFANNLTNSHPELGRYRIFYGSPLITDSTLRPRTIGLTAAYHY